MGFCWTCGAEVSGNNYTCYYCQEKQVKLVNNRILSKTKSLSQYIEHSAEELIFGRLDEDRFCIAADIAASPENIASIIEWCFEDLCWGRVKWAAAISGADQTINSHILDQANQQRYVAEDYRNWGMLSEAESIFQESLKLNPLDYRTYIGLAKTYLAMNQFEEAKLMFNASFSYAPDDFHKSHISRLSGRTFFAEGNFEQAAGCLKQCLILSPGYTLGHYDYAQYCALTKRKEECQNSLKYVFTFAPFLAGLAANENNLKAVIRLEDYPEILQFDSNLFSLLPFEVYLCLAQIEKESNLIVRLLESVPDEIRKMRDECFFNDFDKCWITYKLEINDILNNIHEYFNKKWPKLNRKHYEAYKLKRIKLPELKRSLFLLRYHVSNLVEKYPELLGI